MTTPAFEEVFSGFRIVLADEQQITGLGDLFVEMYAHFTEANGITKLPKDGFKNWMVGYGRTRFVSRTVYICFDGDKIIGLIEGQIRIGGAMSGLGKLGHVAHLYVMPEYRRNGLAKKLYDIQKNWFLGKNISNETLDVVCGNKVALAFWSSIGFKPSFINMIKPVDKNESDPI